MKKIKIILLVLIGAVIGGIISIKASELISSSQVLYKDNNTVSQALNELFASVDINERLGATDISGIGDGTVTDAISLINDIVASQNNNYIGFIDTSRPLKGIIISSNISYTAEEDCYFLIKNYKTTQYGYGATVYLQTGTAINSILNEEFDTTGYDTGIYPLKKGQTISFGVYASGIVNVYGMLK